MVIFHSYVNVYQRVCTFNYQGFDYPLIQCWEVTNSSLMQLLKIGFQQQDC